MSKTHTPGPWKAADYLSSAELVEGPNGKILAMRQDGTAADIRLMAAAPDLLRELQAAHQIIQNAQTVMSDDVFDEWMELNEDDGLVVAAGTGTRQDERNAVLFKATGKPTT